MLRFVFSDHGFYQFIIRGFIVEFGRKVSVQRDEVKQSRK